MLRGALPICRRLSRRLVQAKLADLVGDDVVIAVDIYCQGPRYPSSSAVSMWLRVSQAQSCLLSRAEAASADVLIAPAIAPAGVEGAKGRETARRLGYEAALAALPALRAALRHHGVVPGVTPVGPATSSVQQRLRGTKSSSVTQDRLSTRLQRS